MAGNASLTIGGAFNGATGTVTVPTSLLFGEPSIPGSLNAQIQAYLGGITSGVANGTYNFQNSDLAGNTGTIVGATVSGPAGTFEEFTDVSPTGVSATGSGNYTASITAGVTDLTVQTPGNVTLTGGAPDATTLLFGANSSVDYSVTNPVAGTMYLAGGNNSVTLFSTGLANAETIYSAGSDTINLEGQGTDYVTVFGNATIQDLSANAVVTAEGNATTNLYWDSQNSGGTLNFTNNSSVAATIHIGNFNGATSATHVTAFGGAGGGYYVGGAAGDNSLVGGTGAVTLVGAGPGDFLEANSAQENILAQGGGAETLLASSSTGDNVFGAGLQYPGIGGNPAASGVISTDGAGNQTFFLGNVPGGESVFGSTASTASNTYFIVSGTVGGATVGGGLYSIYNFTGANSNIFLSNGNGGAGSASISSAYVDQGHSGQYDVNLSDGTVIELKGLTASEIAGIHTVTAFGVTGITG
jgi:hypothetical protein